MTDGPSAEAAQAFAARRRQRQLATNNTGDGSKGSLWRVLLRYFLASGLVGAALLARMLLDPLWGDKYSYLTFAMAVLLALEVVGRGPALFALFLSVILADWFFTPPRGVFGAFGAGEVLGGLLFMFFGAALLYFSHQSSRAKAREKSALETLAVQAEEARRNETNYRKLFDSMAEGFLLVELVRLEEKVVSYRFIEANPAVEKLSGWKRSEFLGRDARELESSLDPGWMEMFERVANTGNPERVERYEPALNGWFEANVYRPQADRVAMVFSNATETRQMRLRLEEAEARFRGVFEHAGVGMAQVNRHGNIELVNPFMCEMLGYVREELLSMNFRDLTVPEDLALEEPHIAAVLAGRTDQYDIEKRFVRKDGSQIWVRLVSSAIRGPGEEELRAIAVVQDVTARRLVEQDLKASESLARRQWAELDSLYRSAGVGLCLLDCQLRFVRVNEYLAKMNGVPAERHVGLTLRDLVPHVADAIEQGLRRVLETGEPAFDVEFNLSPQAPDQPWRTFIQQWVPVTGERGRVLGVNVVAEEITDRKRIEETLRQRAEELEKTMDVAPVAIWVSYDPQCERIVGNRTANEIYEAFSGENVSAGTGQESAGPRRFFRGERELLPEELPMQYAARHAVEVRGAEVEVLLPSGRRIWIWGSASPLLDTEGKVRGCVGAFQDITARKEVEAVLSKSREELEMLVRERTRELQEMTNQLNAFCYSIAHDLRAPLRAQMAFANLLLQDHGQALGEVGSDYARRIAGSAERQGRLVSDLLAHLSVSRTDLPLERVVLAKAVEEARIELAHEVAQKGAVLDVGPVDGTIMANSASLHVVLTNLLTNALKFCREGERPRVRIWTESHDEHVKLSIRDHGIGIEPRFHDKLFGVFQRLHSTKVYPGTGIGLAIVKQAVQRMGGEVGVESQVGQGSTFWVTLKKEGAGKIL